jgi:hypothetical protein
MVKAVKVAMGKAARGFRAAQWPTWILSNMEELAVEAEARPRGNGRITSL